MSDHGLVTMTTEEREAFCSETLPSIHDDDIAAREQHVQTAAYPLSWEAVPRKALDEVIGHVIATGLRVDRLQELVYAPQLGSREWAASCDQPARRIFIHEHFFDSDSDASDRRIIMAHELGHLNNVFDPDDAWMFGGKEGQERAAEIVQRIARQAVSSGIYLGPYHEYCALELAAGAIIQEHFEEETWAILCEIVATGRLDELSAASAQQAKSLPKEGFVPLDINDNQAPNAFAELFTGGLLYGVHSVTDLQRYAHMQRASWEALRSDEVNANAYHVSNFKPKLSVWLLKFQGVVAPR